MVIRVILAFDLAGSPPLIPSKNGSCPKTQARASRSNLIGFSSFWIPSFGSHAFVLNGIPLSVNCRRVEAWRTLTPLDIDSLGAQLIRATTIFPSHVIYTSLIQACRGSATISWPLSNINPCRGHVNPPLQTQSWIISLKSTRIPKRPRRRNDKQS